jgi:hypothetical protein
VPALHCGVWFTHPLQAVLLASYCGRSCADEEGKVPAVDAVPQVDASLVVDVAKIPSPVSPFLAPCIFYLFFARLPAVTWSFHLTAIALSLSPSPIASFRMRRLWRQPVAEAIPLWLCHPNVSCRCNQRWCLSVCLLGGLPSCIAWCPHLHWRWHMSRQCPLL